MINPLCNGSSEQMQPTLSFERDHLFTSDKTKVSIFVKAYLNGFLLS